MSRPFSARVDPRHLRDLLRIQCFVVTREQLLALGFTRHEITANVAARRWQTLGRTVVVLHNAALTTQQQRWAAVLLLKQPAALAGATAAELAGLRGFEDPDVHLVVDRSCSADLPPWVRLHNSRRFSAADIASAGDPPRTSVERALIDAAAWSRRSRRACAILCAGVQQRLTTAHALTEELAGAGAVRHRKILRAVLGDVACGSHTMTELDLGRLAHRAGLGSPRRQVLRRSRDGRARYVDAEFDLPDGAVLSVEVDGAGHLDVETWRADLARQNELITDGALLLRFDSVTVRLEPERVVAALRRVHVAHRRPPR